MFSSEPQAFENNTKPANWPTFESLAAAFLDVANARLSDTQKLVLVMSNRLLKFQKLTVTALADFLSLRSGVPYSTVKWNLRSLMEMGLLVGGTAENKGQLAYLTECAKMLAAHLE